MGAGPSMSNCPCILQRHVALDSLSNIRDDAAGIATIYINSYIMHLLRTRYSRRNACAVSEPLTLHSGLLQLLQHSRRVLRLPL